MRRARKNRECVRIRTNHDSHRKFEFPMYNREVIIRFGAPNRVDNVSRGAIQFNSPTSIRKCQDKIKSKRIFRRHGIPSPNFGAKPKWHPSVKKMLVGSRGKGMTLIEDLKGASKEQDFYFEEFVECDMEFRVHVIGKKVFHVDRKHLKNGREEHWMKNTNHGYRYLETGTEKLTVKAKRSCIEAVHRLGLVFGAVDIGVNTKTREYYIYEVNSAPGLRTITKQKYQEALIKYIKSLRIKEV